MAGRSPDGKPQVFVAQQDYDALRKKYESLLETTKESKPDWRSKAWVMAISAIGIAIVIAVAYHPNAAAQVEPFGEGYYTSNNVAGIHAANAFCGTRKEQRKMKPVDALGNSGLLFKCIMSAEELAADERAAAENAAAALEVTLSPEQRARCVDLRDQMRRAAEVGKGTDPDAAIDAAVKMEKLESEADSLKCWRKP
jgi:hypothetical protein